MDVARLATFVAAAELGSLSRAASHLDAQLSTISRRIADLEAEVGVPLLDRTGRGVRLTPAGERFAARARLVLRELDAATAEARGERRAALSQLCISAPVELALRLLPDVIASLTAAHPELSVEVRADARRVSLLEEDVDVALRLGPLGESSLVARPIGTVSLVVLARPSRARAIRTLADLRRAEVVMVGGARREIAITTRGRTSPLELRGRCRVGTFTEAAALAAVSDRIAVVPSFTAAPAIARRELVRVLPHATLPGAPLHQLHPQRLRGAEVLDELAARVRDALARAERALTTRAAR